MWYGFYSNFGKKTVFDILKGFDVYLATVVYLSNKWCGFYISYLSLNYCFVFSITFTNGILLLLYWSTVEHRFSFDGHVNYPVCVVQEQLHLVRSGTSQYKVIREKASCSRHFRRRVHIKHPFTLEIIHE